MPNTPILALTYPSLTDAPNGPGAIQTALTSIEASRLPRGMLLNGYAQSITSQGSITAAVDLTGLTVTVTVGSGRRIQITGYVVLSQSSTASTGFVTINEGATVLQNAGSSIIALGFATLMPVITLTPSAGAHTYKLQALTTAGVASTSAGATQVMWIRVDDIGI